MNPQSTFFCTRRRLALEVCAGKRVSPRGAPPFALDILMR
jgi:hypothetical protein